VPIRIAKKNLPCSVRPHFGTLKVSVGGRQMLFPFPKIIDAQSEVIASIVRMHGLGAFTD
jgi:hypothetical protein